jgi:hypothetical protein
MSKLAYSFWMKRIILLLKAFLYVGICQGSQIKEAIHAVLYVCRTNFQKVSSE